MSIKRLNFYAVIAGTYIPLTDCKLSFASNGSLSTVSGTTSLTMLDAMGIDVYTEGQTEKGASIDIYAGYDGNEEWLFSGVGDEFDLDMDASVMTFSGRDHAANMVDTKETVAELQYKNQTIGQFVEQVAKHFDLTPNVKDPGIKAGVEMWGESALMPHTQQIWSVLQNLAQMCGYECYVDKKELYFGPADKASAGNMTIVYGASQKDKPKHPCRGLKITYQPRRNGNVEVHVISYHAQTAKKHKGKAKARGKKAGGRKKKDKTLIGHNSKGKQTAKSGGSKPSARPIITRRRDGLTKEQADAMAESMAKDIAKRQVVIKATLDGEKALSIHDKLKLKEAQDFNLFGFDELEYYVTAVNHSLSMASGGNDGGWVMDFTAMTQPEVEE